MRVGAGIAILAGLGFLLVATRASAAPFIYPDGSAEIPNPPESPDASVGYPEDNGPAPVIDMSATDPVASFLYMIMACEHNALAVASGDAYRTFYGGSLFSDMSDHPVLTGEKKGIPLAPATCRAAGIASGAFRLASPLGAASCPPRLTMYAATASMSSGLS